MGLFKRPQRPQREHPMRLHGNAKTAPYTRELMVRRVLKQAEPVRDTAAAFGGIDNNALQVAPKISGRWGNGSRGSELPAAYKPAANASWCGAQNPQVASASTHRLGDLRAAVCTCLHGVTVAASARRGKTPGSGAQTTSTKVRTSQSGRDLAPGYQETRPYRFVLDTASMVTWPARAVEQGGSSHMLLWMTTAGSPTSR